MKVMEKRNIEPVKFESSVYMRMFRVEEDCKQLLADYKALVNESFNDDLVFDDMVTLFSCFHIFRPIDPKEHATVQNAVILLHKLLDDSGIPIIGCQQLVDLGDKGFRACDCGIYLSRNWCIHCFVDCFDRGIITDYPIRMNPKGTRKGQPSGYRPSGAPKKARKGGFFDIDAKYLSQIE